MEYSAFRIFDLRSGLFILSILRGNGTGRHARKRDRERGTYFVLNGTSSSNKIVLQSLVTEDDLVPFDRNNHKAAHHGALKLGNDIPVSLKTDPRRTRVIDPIDHHQQPIVVVQSPEEADLLSNVPALLDSTHGVSRNRMLLRSLSQIVLYQVLEEAIANLIRKHPGHYGGVRLRDLRRQMQA